MIHNEIENIKKIISSSILYRIFYWKNIVLMIGEIKKALEQYYEQDKRLNVLEKEYEETNKTGVLFLLKGNIATSRHFFLTDKKKLEILQE